jgi:methylenetetrahydrofolate reductase (NADPH)
VPSSARISDLLAEGRCISFEFFPPRTDEAEEQLERTLCELAPLAPSFVSFTYGAGGSTRERTRDLVVEFQRRTALPAMAHLTCIGHRATEMADMLMCYRAAGVTNILALRGDPPTGGGLPETDLTHAADLVDLIRGVGGFSIGVAAHPEGHPASPDRETDRRHLAAKLRRADFAITQFFFRAEDYLSMVDDLAHLGADQPILPGIMPVTNLRQVQRFAELSAAEIPAELSDRLHRVADDPAEVRRVGVAAATELCDRLLAAGVPGLHFYTLNRSQATSEILANLGLAVAAPTADAIAATATA